MREDEITCIRRPKSRKGAVKNSKDILSCFDVKHSLLRQNQRGVNQLKKLHLSLYEMLDTKRVLSELKERKQIKRSYTRRAPTKGQLFMRKRLLSMKTVASIASSKQ